jgi:hypothetical protein
MRTYGFRAKSGHDCASRTPKLRPKDVRGQDSVLGKQMAATRHTGVDAWSPTGSLSYEDYRQNTNELMAGAVTGRTF